MLLRTREGTFLGTSYVIQKQESEDLSHGPLMSYIIICEQFDIFNINIQNCIRRKGLKAMHANALFSSKTEMQDLSQ